MIIRSINYCLNRKTKIYVANSEIGCTIDPMVAKTSNKHEMDGACLNQSHASIARSAGVPLLLLMICVSGLAMALYGDPYLRTELATGLAAKDAKPLVIKESDCGCQVKTGKASLSSKR